MTVQGPVKEQQPDGMSHGGEAEFSEKCQPEDVEMNFRFIDDILTLTGIIPTEKEYGM